MKMTNCEAYDKYLDMKSKELTPKQIKNAFEKAKAKQGEKAKQPKEEFVKC